MSWQGAYPLPPLEDYEILTRSLISEEKYNEIKNQYQSYIDDYKLSNKRELERQIKFIKEYSDVCSSRKQKCSAYPCGGRGSKIKVINTITKLGYCKRCWEKYSNDPLYNLQENPHCFDIRHRYVMNYEEFYKNRCRREININESWYKLRKLVWTRDKEICHVCGYKILLEDYHCGHIIDRCLDGPDRASNVVAMHGWCNFYKPGHKNREEYLSWLASSHIVNDVLIR
jgi:hypothetical protein